VNDLLVRALASVVSRRFARIAESIQLFAVADAWQRLAAVTSRWPNRKVLMCYFTEQMPILFVGLASVRYRVGTLPPSFFTDIRVVRDDSIGGRLSAELLVRNGVTPLSLRWRSAAARAADLKEIIRVPRPIAIGVDSHGPYGQVGPAFARLVRRCDAVVIPVGIAADRTHRIRLRAPLAIPRVGARIAFAIGDPIDDPASGELASSIARSIHAARDAAQASLLARQS
jgi:hypothetical protein